MEALHSAAANGPVERTLDRLFVAAGVLAALFLAVIGGLTLAQIVGRSLGFLVSTGTEFAGYCMAASTFLALPWTLRQNAHIRVDLLIGRAGPKVRHAVECWCLVLALLAIGLLAYSAGQMAWQSYEFGDLSTGLIAVPLWIPQLAMVAGIALLELSVLDDLVRALSGRTPTYRRLDTR